jgi:RNA polymerase sigma factor (sigma-70 family)
MSNEELVAEIQAGATERMSELWEQVEGLIKWNANRIMTVLEGCPGRGVEFEDLYQSGYLAMVTAVNTYNPTAGGNFATWLMYHLKSAFAEATGYRTQKGRQEPLNNYLSLDTPLTDDTDSDSLMDLIADPSGQNGIISAEDALYREQLHDAMEEALSAIPEQYADALRLRYYDGLSLNRAGEIRGVSGERIRSMENKGIRLLRNSQITCYLRPFYDFDVYCGTGLGAFQRTGRSIQEHYLIREEERQKRAQERERQRQQRQSQDRIQREFAETMERIEAEAADVVSKMSPEEKERLLRQGGYL